MPDSQVEEIKNRLDLADIIRGYMKIEKSGANLRGLCPFHREKTPSFFVSPARQLWRCFGCSMGGDMFTFIQEIEGVEFKEALKTLADKAGVQLRSYDPKTRSERTRLYEICEKACQFFEHQLASSSLGDEAKQYLAGRGIRDESMEKFRIGFAPYTRDALSRYLREQSYSPNEIFKSGVAIQGNSDRFRSRIMFPIFDVNRQVIGFGGRIFFAANQAPDPKLAKYINTPQTLLYDKSKVLYGLDKAKMKIREHDSCMLVEGYTDVIMAHQAGNENVAAVSGTSLTEQQLDLARRYTENLVILFDMDIAGDNATKRGIDLAQRKGFNIKVVSLPEGKDPAEIIQKDEKKWRKAVAAPLSIGEFYFTTALSRFDKRTPEGMKAISYAVLPAIREMPSAVEQSFWVQKLASELSCGEDAVWNDLAKVKLQDAGIEDDQNSAANAPASVPVAKSKRERLYERMLLLSIRDKNCMQNLRKRDLAFFDANNTAAAIFLNIYSRKRDVNSDHDFYTGFSHEEGEYLNGLVFQEEVFPTFSSDTDFAGEFEACRVSLLRLAFQDELRSLAQTMRKGKNDRATMERFQKISLELANLN